MPSTKSEIAKLLEPAPSVESIISKGFHEKLGSSQTTTLLHLDAGTLEAICRLNLPGVPLERLSVSAKFSEDPLAFQQHIIFSCGNDLSQFELTVTQCTSHVDAIKVMKKALALRSMSLAHLSHLYDDEDKQSWEAAKLGNYAVKSMNGSHVGAVIWTRWTTVIEVGIPGKGKQP